tara:strand:- start:1138 stop:2253 length:1116 start_codon:yes stop_codon:yes gene_type:complete
MTAIPVQFVLDPETAGPLDTRVVGTSSNRPTGTSLYAGLWRYETDGTPGWVYYDGSSWQSVSFGLSGHQTITCVDNGQNLPALRGNGSNNVHVFYADDAGEAHELKGYEQITCVQYSNTVNSPALRGNNGANNVHVFYAEDAGEAYELKGYQQITCVNSGGNLPMLKGNGSDNVRVNYANVSAAAITATSATQLTGYRTITSVNNGGYSWLYSNNSNNLHVFYADYAGLAYNLIISDDKVKWNETKINSDRSIEIIKDIQFTEYDILKGELVSEELPNSYDVSKCEHGFGVIAQDIETLAEKYPELKDTTQNKQIGENTILTVNYNNILSLLGATTQKLISRIENLDQLVQSQAALISALQTRVSALESAQ